MPVSSGSIERAASMQVLVRADASRTLGIGHVTRCLTLAKQLHARGADVVFACRKLEGHIWSEIEAAGFEVRDPDARDDSRCDWLVVDHYELDARYESAMRARADRIFVVDDLADRSHDCDLLLDQNLYADMERRYFRYIPDHARMLAGPQFALLRPEFAEARLKVKRPQALQRIFVFFGGSDPTNETLKVLSALREIQHTDITVTALVGVSNPRREELAAFARTMSHATLMDQTDRISDVMLANDLAIAAGGSTTWERCCLGLPSIAISIADNQTALSQTLGERGYQKYLGESSGVTTATILECVERALDDFSEMQGMGLRSMELVDGLGAERVVATLESI
jgi:UDP-2,4-diacetamido-2,4,6-trideoxy-beta-L-altropyranose hydrolase